MTRRMSLSLPATPSTTESRQPLLASQGPSRVRKEWSLKQGQLRSQECVCAPTQRLAPLSIMLSKYACMVMNSLKHSEYSPLQMSGQCEQGRMNRPLSAPRFSSVLRASREDSDSEYPQIALQGSKGSTNREPRESPVASFLSRPQILKLELKSRAASGVLRSWFPGTWITGVLAEICSRRVRNYSQLEPLLVSRSQPTSPLMRTASISCSRSTLLRSLVMGVITLMFSLIVPQSARATSLAALFLGRGSISEACTQESLCGVGIVSSQFEPQATQLKVSSKGMVVRRHWWMLAVQKFTKADVFTETLSHRIFLKPSPEITLRKEFLQDSLVLKQRTAFQLEEGSRRTSPQQILRPKGSQGVRARAQLAIASKDKISRSIQLYDKQVLQLVVAAYRENYYHAYVQILRIKKQRKVTEKESIMNKYQMVRNHEQLAQTPFECISVIKNQAIDSIICLQEANRYMQDMN